MSKLEDIIKAKMKPKEKMALLAREFMGDKAFAK